MLEQQMGETLEHSSFFDSPECEKGECQTQSIQRASSILVQERVAHRQESSRNQKTNSLLYDRNKRYQKRQAGHHALFKQKKQHRRAVTSEKA